MDTVKQVYLLDEKGNKYSPIVSPQSIYVDDNITLNEHLGFSNQLVLFSTFDAKGVGSRTFNSQIPTQNIVINDTSYFTISGGKAICQKSGTYKVEAYIRIDDKLSVTNTQDVNQNDDFSIEVIVSGSVNRECHLWRDTTFRACQDIAVTIDIQSGQSLGMTTRLCRPTFGASALANCGFMSFRVYTM